MGVLRDENDDDSVIPVITPEEFKEFVAQGIIQGGMIPKLENSFSAIDAHEKSFCFPDFYNYCLFYTGNTFCCF